MSGGETRERLVALADRPVIIAAARIGGIVAGVFGALGTALASVAVWVFLQAWGDIRDLAKSDGRKTGEIAALSATSSAHGERLGLLEGVVFRGSKRAERDVGGGHP